MVKNRRGGVDSSKKKKTRNEKMFSKKKKKVLAGYGRYLQKKIRQERFIFVLESQGREGQKQKRGHEKRVSAGRPPKISGRAAN